MSIFIWPLSFLFLLLPIIVYFTLPPVKENSNLYALKIPFFKRLTSFSNTSTKTTYSKSIRFFLVLSWILFTLAAARPVWYPKVSDSPLHARNIVLSLDVSESMSEKDFQLGTEPVSRLTAVKKVVTNFLNERESDNIGFVLFGNEAYTYAPLSFDKTTLKSLLEEIGIGIAGNMTALGDGLALAVQTALKVPAKSQIVILLSDGYANTGVVSVPEAIKLAKRNDVKVYTIGIGSNEQIVQNFYGLQVPTPSTLDEKTLKQIASQTGGQYFLAKTTSSLQDIYKVIDNLEKEEISTQSYKPRKELFFIPLFLGLLCLFIALMKRRQL